MKKRFRKSTLIGTAIIFLLIILIAIYFIHKDRENRKNVFQTYDEAINWGMKEFEDQAVVLKDIKINDTFKNTNLVFYAIEDASKVYISKITSDKYGFGYERLTPTYSWNIDNGANVSFDVPITINGQRYYVLIGKVKESYSAYYNENELKLDSNRIFIKINTENKNKVIFK